MNTHVSLGGQEPLKLSHAVLVYSGALQGRAFGRALAVQCPVLQDGETMRLGPAEPLRTPFLHALQEALSGGKRATEFLPGNVLINMPTVVAWWTRPTVQSLFFPDSARFKEVDGKPFPIPGLVWKVVRGHLHIVAVKGVKRPGPEVPVYEPPFSNIWEGGKVCQGSMPAPRETSIEAIPRWERAFWVSRFAGTQGIWTPELVGKKTFPTKYLKPLRAKTLIEWLGAEGGT